MTAAVAGLLMIIGFTGLVVCGLILGTLWLVHSVAGVWDR